MIKSELIERLTDQFPTLTAVEVDAGVDAILEIMIETLEAGNRVELRGFGTLSVRHREAREGRNPRTGASVPVAEKFVPFFKTGKELRDAIDAAFQRQRAGT